MKTYTEDQIRKKVAIDNAVLDGSAEWCLDHGFVRVVDTMGDDSAIAEAARVSYGAGTKATSDDRGLIRYLLSHRHTTPFEMCEIKFHVKVPVFVARQWIRHRTANVNEVSGRYSLIPNEFYVPETRDISPQSSTNRQGREGALPEVMRHAMQETLRQGAEGAFQTYEELCTGWPWVGPDGEPWSPDVQEGFGPHSEENGMSRELARINLPLSMYTEFYWKIDLHNLLHFLSLRADTHAQKEIRVFAEAMLRMVAKWCPLAYEAFQDYKARAVTLSYMEVVRLKDVLRKQLGENYLDVLRPEENGSQYGLTPREITEFLEKMGVK